VAPAGTPFDISRLRCVMVFPRTVNTTCVIRTNASLVKTHQPNVVDDIVSLGKVTNAIGVVAFRVKEPAGAFGLAELRLDGRERQQCPDAWPRPHGSAGLTGSGRMMEPQSLGGR
jgi:hypothetical protein